MLKHLDINDLNNISDIQKEYSDLIFKYAKYITPSKFYKRIKNNLYIKRSKDGNGNDKTSICIYKDEKEIIFNFTFSNTKEESNFIIQLKAPPENILPDEELDGILEEKFSDVKYYVEGLTYTNKIRRFFRNFYKRRG